MLLRLLCAVLMMGVMVGPARAATLFSDTFDNYGNEAATVSALQSRYGCSYSNAFNNGYAQDLDSSQKFNGTFSIKQSYTGSQYANPPQGGGSCSYDFLGFDGSLRKDIWITWYHRFDGNFKTGGDESDPLLVGSVATKGLYMNMKSLSTGQENGWVFHYFYGGTQLFNFHHVDIVVGAFQTGQVACGRTKVNSTTGLAGARVRRSARCIGAGR